MGNVAEVASGNKQLRSADGDQLSLSSSTLSELKLPAAKIFDGLFNDPAVMAAVLASLLQATYYAVLIYKETRGAKSKQPETTNTEKDPTPSEREKDGSSLALAT
jgi:hypothetical protein